MEPTKLDDAVAPEGNKPAGMTAASIAKLAVAGALLVAIGVIARGAKPEELDVALPTPELFSEAAATCPRNDPAEARAIADDLRARADGARERSPFDPREALSAIKSYETAAACCRIAKDVEGADDAAHAARRMRDETLLDFRSRRVRLERLLIVKDYELAAQDVRVLRALTEGRQSEYSQWLGAVARDLENQQVENVR
ncbi:MAG: hypothetical protein KF819_04265 [Labilithrix sp.]|nr:hypothetical protein [Labilithrix sp.]